MVNVNVKDRTDKKKGLVIDDDLAKRIRVRKSRLTYNGYSYRTFALAYGFKKCNVEAAIRERRQGSKARQILTIIDRLPRESGQANREK